MNEDNFAFDSRLDIAYLNSLYEGDKEHAAMIFEQFLLGIQVQMKVMDDNFASGNTEQLRKKLHELKPGFSFVGLTWLSGKAEIIEKKCYQITGTGDIAELYKDLRNNIVEYIPVIKNELSKLKG